VPANHQARRGDAVMELSGGSIVTSFQSISHAARSWLGSSHGHTYKCIIDGNDPRASALVGDLRSYLLAVNSDPTATGLLLETLETVVCELLSRLIQSAARSLDA